MCFSRPILGWVDLKPSNEKRILVDWNKQLPELVRFFALRCFRPLRFKKIYSCAVASQDASQKLRMQLTVTYTRLVSKREKAHCFFLFGKSRLVPIKPLIIPRMELCGAVVAFKLYSSRFFTFY